MTTAASVAFGIRPSSGASSSMVASAAPAVTSEAFCDCPPAARTTAVCEVPPPAGIAPSSAPPRLAAPVAISSRLALIGGSAGRAKARPAAIVSVKLISAIPSAPGSSCSTSDRSGIVSAGRPCGIRPTIDTPCAFSPKNHAAAMPPPTATSGAGECGHRRSMPISTTNVADGHRQRQQRGVRHVLRDAHQVGEEPLLGDVDAQQLGHLVEHDDQADPGLEAGEHRRGNEIGDEPQAQHGRQQQHHADQRGERGRRRHELGRVAVRHRQPQLRAGQDRQRGGGADAEHPRRAEQRIDHHRDEGGVQADGDGQAGHARVGHGLGQHDRRGRQTGDHVEAKCAGAGRDGPRFDRRRVHAVASARTGYGPQGGTPPAAPRSEAFLDVPERIVGGLVAADLALGQHDLLGGSRLVRNMLQEVADHVQAHALLVLRTCHEPRCP